MLSRERPAGRGDHPYFWHHVNTPSRSGWGNHIAASIAITPVVIGIPRRSCESGVGPLSKSILTKPPMPGSRPHPRRAAKRGVADPERTPNEHQRVSYSVPHP